MVDELKEYAMRYRLPWYLRPEPPSKRRSISKKIVEELETAALNIKNVRELREYADNFPSPYAGTAIKDALSYLAESKIRNGKRDGKKIFHHIQLGYGPRLIESDELVFRPTSVKMGTKARDILIAIGLFVQKEWPKTNQLSYAEKLQHKKFFGVEEPEELVYLFCDLLAKQLRKHST